MSVNNKDDSERIKNGDCYPRYLYKYFSFDSKHHYNDILLNDLLYFSSPVNFNDPFDCSLSISYKGKDKEFVKNYLVNEILPLQVSNVDEEMKHKAELFIEEKYSELDPNLTDNHNMLQHNYLNGNLSSGVCCFSELNNNILMWGHYADKHSGFCLRFNYTKLVKYICKHR